MKAYLTPEKIAKIDNFNLRIFYSNLVNKRHEVEFARQNLANLIKPKRAILSSIPPFEQDLLIRLLKITSVDLTIE